jgi:DNA-binding transcriptional LysR family regulator
MTDLNTLIIFARVVDANSFSEAARRLKMPTSTVSRRIADLEEQLGVRLLERSTRRLRLTDIGSEVLVHARRGAELSDAVDNIASDHQSNVSGLLRLSAPPSISDSLIAPLVGAFQAAHPNAGVGIGELPPLVQPELLRNGRLVEVMPTWRFRTRNLSVAHRANRYLPRPVRIFKAFAAEMAPTLFPELPT